MRAYERLLRYVQVHTTSCDESETIPSADIEFDLANILVKELQDFGILNAYVDDKCYVYAYIPASEGYESCKKIGFIAHMDTSPDFNGENVNPIVIENYNGGIIELGDSGKQLDPEKFPELSGFIGKTVITTDGTSLLGADDKSGIAEIMTAVEEIISEGRPHGRICIAFTPDEEIGRGADFFDVKEFGAEFAYTVDGGAENELEYENFNAAEAIVIINGLNVHPGYAKGKMINSQLVAMEFNDLLPLENPSNTQDREGFYHLTDISGNVENTVLKYILRDHDMDNFIRRKNIMVETAEIINEKYGDNTVEITISDQYSNMLEQIIPHMHLIDNALTAIRVTGENPVVVPIRGGTDGARLSFMGLPCPNLGTGGYDFHGPLEHICAESMDTVVNIIKNIVDLYASEQYFASYENEPMVESEPEFGLGFEHEIESESIYEYDSELEPSYEYKSELEPELESESAPNVSEEVARKKSARIKKRLITKVLGIVVALAAIIYAIFGIKSMFLNLKSGNRYKAEKSDNIDGLDQIIHGDNNTEAEDITDIISDSSTDVVNKNVTKSDDKAQSGAAKKNENKSTSRPATGYNPLLDEFSYSATEEEAKKYVVVARDGIIKNHESLRVGEILDSYGDSIGRWTSYVDEEDRAYAYYEGKKDNKSFIVEFLITGNRFTLTDAYVNGERVQSLSTFFNNILSEAGV